MKSVMIIAAVLFSSVAIYAQSPVPLPDTATSIRQGDPEPKHTQTDVNYAKDMMRITAKELPAAVQQTLNNGAQYEDWEKAAIYKTRSTGIYIVEMQEADNITHYKFDKTGKTVHDNKKNDQHP